MWYLHEYMQVLSYCNSNLTFVLCLHALNVNIALIFFENFPKNENLKHIAILHYYVKRTSINIKFNMKYLHRGQ